MINKNKITCFIVTKETEIVLLSIISILCFKLCRDGLLTRSGILPISVNNLSKLWIRVHFYENYV